MTPLQYRTALKKLGINAARGAAPFFGISDRHAQKIAKDGPVPKLVAKVLKLLVEGKISKDDLA
jgi:hypothetical protein